MTDLFDDLHGVKQDIPKPVETGPLEQTEPDVTPDKDRGESPTLPIDLDEVEMLFELGGVPRIPRSIRRYCENKSLECFKVDTQHGQRWMADRASVEKYILQLQQTEVASKRSEPVQTGTDRYRPDDAGKDLLKIYKEQSEREFARIEENLDFLRAQLLEKDVQMKRKDEHVDQLTETITTLNQTAGMLGTLAGALLPPPAPKEKPTVVPPTEPETGDSEVS